MASNYAKANIIKYDVKQRKGFPKTLLIPKQLIAVVGVKTKPLYELEDIINEAIKEAKTLYDTGIRNIMIQNVKDVPFNDSIDIQTVASMTAICKAIRDNVPTDCILGLSMLKDNGKALVTVASAAQMDYIRPKCYIGAVVAHDGIHEGIINDVLNTKQELKWNGEIIPDIFDRSTARLSDTSLIEAVGQATSFGLCNAINIAGKNFEESITMVDEIKKKFPNLYVNLGGGANLNNLEEVYKHFDGAFVSSCLRKTGNMTGSLDKVKLKNFYKKYKDVIK